MVLADDPGRHTTIMLPIHALQLRSQVQTIERKAITSGEVGKMWETSALFLLLRLKFLELRVSLQGTHFNPPGKGGSRVVAWFLTGYCQGGRLRGHGKGARPHTVDGGASPLAVDLDGNGTLQQADGDDQAPSLVHVGNDAFQTR